MISDHFQAGIIFLKAFTVFHFYNLPYFSFNPQKHMLEYFNSLWFLKLNNSRPIFEKQDKEKNEDEYLYLWAEIEYYNFPKIL